MFGVCILCCRCGRPAPSTAAARGRAPALRRRPPAAAHCGCDVCDSTATGSKVVPLPPVLPQRPDRRAPCWKARLSSAAGMPTLPAAATRPCSSKPRRALPPTCANSTSTSAAQRFGDSRPRKRVAYLGGLQHDGNSASAMLFQMETESACPPPPGLAWLRAACQVRTHMHTLLVPAAATARPRGA